MGFFSFLGKGLKAVSKIAGFIPGVGGTISKVTGLAGNLLDHKAPMATTQLKMRVFNPVILRGQDPAMGSGSLMTAAGMRSSPVLPGGAIATRSGPVSRRASPPRTFGGFGGKRKASSAARQRKARKTGPRRTSRKLKFGSAAFRKKYLGKARRRR
jgi:hypothetical protein